MKIFKKNSIKIMFASPFNWQLAIKAVLCLIYQNQDLKEKICKLRSRFMGIFTPFQIFSFIA